MSVPFSTIQLYTESESKHTSFYSLGIPTLSHEPFAIFKKQSIFVSVIQC